MLTLIGKRLIQLVPTAVPGVGLDLLAAAIAAGGSGPDHGRGGEGPGGDRADPPAVPARSAAAGPVPLLDQGRADGRSRRVDAAEGVGRRADRPEAPRDPAARRHGDDHRPRDRRHSRHRVGGQEGHGVGLRREHPRALGHLDAELLARDHADLPVRRDARLAAGLRLRAPVGGLAPEPRHHDHAGLRARQLDRRRHHAAHPKRHAAGAPERLRAHRSGQGPVRNAGSSSSTRCATR